MTRTFGKSRHRFLPRSARVGLPSDGIHDHADLTKIAGNGPRTPEPSSNTFPADGRSNPRNRLERAELRWYSVGQSMILACNHADRLERSVVSEKGLVEILLDTFPVRVTKIPVRLSRHTIDPIVLMLKLVFLKSGHPSVCVAFTLWLTGHAANLPFCAFHALNATRCGGSVTTWRS